MSKKYCIYSDLHWSQYSSIVRKRGSKYSIRLQNLIKSVNWVEDLAIKMNCDEMISCGDWFDKPDLNAEEITALKDIHWNHLPKSFLVGNHESNINTLEFSSTNFFDSLGSTVYDSVSKVNVNDYVDFYFIPYILPDQISSLKEYISDDNKKKVIFAHGDLAGLQYGKFTSVNGFDIEDIKSNCSLFINGHLHNSQIIDDKIILVGNLTGQNFNENANQYEHLAYILTVEDDGRLILEQFENPYAFNFYKIKIEDRRDLDKLLKLKPNSIVSISCADFLVREADTILNNNSNILEHRTTVIYSDVTNLNSSDTFKIEDHLKQFIDFAYTKIEQSQVLDDELSRLGGAS